MHMECALILVTCLVQCKSEDRASVISCAWVVEPSPIPETGFPVEGRCYTGGRRLAFLTHFFCAIQVSLYVYIAR